MTIHNKRPQKIVGGYPYRRWARKFWHKTYGRQLEHRIKWGPEI